MKINLWIIYIVWFCKNFIYIVGNIIYIFIVFLEFGVKVIGSIINNGFWFVEEIIYDNVWVSLCVGEYLFIFF